MDRVNAWTAATVGAVSTGVLSFFSVGWPAGNLGIGFALTGGLLLLLADGRKRYALAGTAYTLATGLLFYTIGSFPAVYTDAVVTPLLGFGAISGVVVTGKAVGRRIVVGLLGDGYAGKIYDAVAAFVGLLGMAWVLLNIVERITRYTSVTVGLVATLVLNFLGVEIPLFVPILDESVNAVLAVFVGSSLVGFHALESLHAGWRATKTTVQSGASAGGSVARRAVEKFKSAQRDRSDRDH